MNILQSREGNKFEFIEAEPVWPAGLESEKNIMAGFRTVFVCSGTGPCLLRIAASTVYRCYLNGEFAGYGPAIASHGYFRVDEWPLNRMLKDGDNILAIEVAGYNVNSYYLLNQPAFLQAEIIADDKVIAATSPQNGCFEAAILPERLQKVHRYSLQRPFSEVYRLQPDYGLWRVDRSVPMSSILDITSAKRTIGRGVPYPAFSVRQPKARLREGQVKVNEQMDSYRKLPYFTAIGPKLGGFKEDELDIAPVYDVQRTVNIANNRLEEDYAEPQRLHLTDQMFTIYDFGSNLSGFIGLTVHCARKTKLYVLFDEVLIADDIDPLRLVAVNIVSYEMPPGQYTVESFEPYTCRYVKLLVMEGDCVLERLQLREYANPDTRRASFRCSDPGLNLIYEAGKETFRQNAIDNFMDCPSRERAGWLCDSFFTSRVAMQLTGNTQIEHNFFENYALPERFEHLPEGMLPMCYPADHNDGVFIPNWALWFVLQLEEYLLRSNDREMIERLRARVTALFAYFQQFRNEEGLLEKLDSWVFVEWSEANHFVQDVNYPTNMLYAAALAAAGRLYAVDEWTQEAEVIQRKIREQANSGLFFADHANRTEGRLEVQDDVTEVCQYFAFYFGTATPQTHPRLWEELLDIFGPRRKERNVYPNVHQANAFIGNYVRLELLSSYGEINQLAEELKQYFLYMAEQTGTLWEHNSAGASCNHGFASHIVHVLYRDILGVYKIDPQARVVELRFPD
ncbi:hypothetical protein [Paenibacillus sp. GCM10027626]|uniref:alpha-L-rhamnosidase-related protein n=1 Tax=Paenibacillus sp. GCM10027626 TaxID=3273411 RepID=UPI00363B90B4